MENWQNDLAGHWQMAWHILQDPAHQQGTPPGLATLATTGVDGHPEARSVVIRAVDPVRMRVDIYTDGATPKVAELSANPLGTLLIWDGPRQVQIRMACEFEFLSGLPAQDIWARLGGEARGNYGVMPVPGTPISAPDAYSRVPDPARLTVLRACATRLDVVHLGSPRHSRALFTRDTGWQGQWLAP